MPPYIIRKIDANLFLVALTPPLPGFESFIGIWAHTGRPSFVVDVGPAATSASLLKALRTIGVRQLDYLLLTHIHIDHAGGIGEVAAAFPEARIVGHAKGLPHLAQPERLWQGSLKSLGPTAEAYGAIRAVAPDRVMDAEVFDEAAIQVIPTPGHSPHHISFALEDLLFAGEAGGVCLAVDGRPYLRPATPPRFFMDVTLASLDRLIARAPRKIAYSHLGLFREAALLLQSHRRQLLLWEQVIGRALAESPSGDPVEACLARLRQADTRLGALSAMPVMARKREEGFLRNSIRGFIGDLQERAAKI
jgi:glyoxylase-like metal-dependent hydrolase (beta-lactamase superfamily II)